MFSRQNLQLLLPLGFSKPCIKLLNYNLGRDTKDSYLIQTPTFQNCPSLPQAKLDGNPSSS